MVGDADPFEFDLARELGMTVTEMRHKMPQAEYVAWRAFSVYRKAMNDLEGS